MFANALLRLISPQLTEPNPPDKEGYDYGYAMFKPLPDIHFIIINMPPYIL